MTDQIRAIGATSEPALEVEAFQTPALPRAGGRPVLTQVIHAEYLRPVAERAPLTEYLDALWGRRYFIVADARARVVSGTRGTLLGSAWLVLRPVLDAIVYFVIFGVVLRSNKGIENFLGYLLVGVFLFRFTTSCLTTGARSIVSSGALVKSFSFPRAALPVATVMREAVQFFPAVIAMSVVILLLPPAEVLTWRVALIPVILVLQFLFTLGVVFIVARASVRLPDLQNIIGILTRFWLYGSAVFFSYERFIHHPAILHAVRMNPMFIVLDMVRDCLLYGVTPALSSWLILAAWAFAALIFGLVWFWRGEERYGSI